jgi:hypothetical protein
MPAPMSVVVVMMVMMPIMMMMVMVVPVVVMVVVMVVPMMMMMVVMVMVVRQLHALFRTGAGVQLSFSVERRQDGDGIGNRLQQFSYAGGAQGLICIL